MCKKKGGIVVLSIVLIVDQNAESLAMQRLIQASQYHRHRANGNSRQGGYGKATSRSVEKAREVVSGINKERGSNV